MIRREYHIPTGLLCDILAEDMFEQRICYGQVVNSNRVVIDEARQFTQRYPIRPANEVAGGESLQAD